MGGGLLGWRWLKRPWLAGPVVVTAWWYALVLAAGGGWVFLSSGMMTMSDEKFAADSGVAHPVHSMIRSRAVLV